MWISKKKLADRDLRMRDAAWHNGLADGRKEIRATLEDRSYAVDEARRILAIQHAVEMTPTPETLLPLAQTIEAYLLGGEEHADALATSQRDVAWLSVELNKMIAERDTAADAAVESDERVQAWDQLCRHPFFAECFDGSSDEPLLTRMLAKLDNTRYSAGFAAGKRYVESRDAVVSEIIEKSQDDDRTHLVDTEAVEEARELITEYEKDPKSLYAGFASANERPVVSARFHEHPEPTDTCAHCGRPIHVGDVFRDRGRKVWYHDTGFNVCLEPMGGTTAEPARGPQGA